MTCDFNQTLKEKNAKSGDLERMKEENANLNDHKKRLISMLQKQTNAMLKERREKEVLAEEIEQMKFALYEGTKDIAALAKDEKVCFIVFSDRD